MQTKLNIKFNPQARWHALRIGKQQTPVILIDDLTLNIDDLRRYAMDSAKFSRETATYYPGVRATLPSPLLHSVMAAIYPSVRQIYGFSADTVINEHASFYSLVCSPAEQLLPLQRIPHFDSTDSRYLAIMLYLNKGSFGGTGFYRHKESGFETIDEDNWPQYKKLRDTYETQYGSRPARYFTESDQEFELMGKIAYKANRLLIYPGCLLHSGLVTEAQDLSSDPASGRLTANFFVQASAK